MMRRSPARRAQRGITLIVGLILLVLVTLMVVSAFTLNTGNLKSVGNMQSRNEALAAANKALEQVMGTQFPLGFLVLPPQQTVSYDINNDGTRDYTITVAVPECVQIKEVAGSGGGGTCGGIRAGGLAGCGVKNYNALWDLKATVTDVSGAQVVVRQGFRTEITETQRAAVCP